MGKINLIDVLSQFYNVQWGLWSSLNQVDQSFYLYRPINSQVKLDSEAQSMGMAVKTGPPKILNNKCFSDLFRIACDYATVCVTE